MAIETFTWATQHGEAPTLEYRTRESRFGGGYKQVVGDGPNNKEDAYPITHTGNKATALAMMAFFDRHQGAKAFLWTTPLGQLGCSPARTQPLRPWAGAYSK